MRIKFDLRPEQYVATVKEPLNIGRIVALVLITASLFASAATFSYGLVLSRALRSERVMLQQRAETMQLQNMKLGKELTRLRKEEETYRKALALIEKEIPSLEFMGVLEKALPPGVWLGEMSVSGSGVTLSGTAYSENDVVSFARAMTDAPVVASVGFPVTSRVRSGNGGAVRFTLACVLSELSAPVKGSEGAGKEGTEQ